eukprot:GEMP01056731.1.p1 GENE.GEMP01056731.1~~GEMP01056731.1.p1  ORF type:complete len:299 (+),score=68.55 GEMP01056731.1:2-898(+)
METQKSPRRVTDPGAQAAEPPVWDYTPRNHLPNPRPVMERKSIGICVNGLILSPRRITTSWEESLKKDEALEWNSSVTVTGKQTTTVRTSTKFSKVDPSGVFWESLRQFKDNPNGMPWVQDSKAKLSQDELRKSRASMSVAGAQLRKQTKSWAESLKTAKDDENEPDERQTLHHALSAAYFPMVKTPRPSQLQRSATDGVLLTPQRIPLRTEAHARDTEFPTTPTKAKVSTVPRASLVNRSSAHATFLDSLRSDEDTGAPMDFRLDKENKGKLMRHFGFVAARFHSDASKYFDRTLRA